ncbi:4a-hydroxytetrahydrobiopterin dehydratase [Flagellimonas meishanensis]|uniref:4a-hydroxytetrahydrobiopterin dehydratase n=1 Tax=Flagellimonas meishanensis TaxID=2873264 RepID=UPI001CA6FDAA|nr:4a-hydroxytetrahydrobiopterin dehydratase [[Muricauda] meishanensis]
MEKLNENQVKEALKKLDGWSLEEGMITKSFKFKDFKEAFAIMTHIAFVCEEQNHHPNWENVYNNLTIKLNTHDVDGITQKDLRLAQSIEGIINP